jgi:hypothetical protein
MKSIAHSNIASLRRALPSKLAAMLVLGLAGAVIAGSITPAAAHKSGGGGGGGWGGGGGHHDHHSNNKPPKNTGPIGPLPKPLPQQPAPAPVVVRDHRAPVVVRDHRTTGGVSVRPTPVVRDHRATASRGSVKCLGNLCGAGKAIKTAVGGAIKSVKRTIGRI